MPHLFVRTHDGVSHDIAVTPGLSVKEAILNEGLEGIEALCGGAANCGTCHVYVSEAWYDRVPPPIEAEELMLPYVIDPRPTSRLSCQIVVGDELDGIEVEIPQSQT